MALVARQLSLPSLPVSLWLSAQTIHELSAAPALATSLRDQARDCGISIAAINAFPYGNFHASRVKHSVYEPSWSDGRRAHYTLAVAELLPLLVSEGAEHISISTLPLGWRKSFSASGSGASVGIASAALEHIASRLHSIERNTGLRITLDIEPEPGCAIETSEELVGFFSHCLPSTSRTGADIRRHIGACVDVCHGAVMGESAHEFFDRCAQAGVSINRVQLSSALKGTPCASDLAALAQFDEPRYLHQVVTGTGASRRMWDDIPEFLADPAAQDWRCHWHVPIHHAMMNGLETTSSAIQGSLISAFQMAHTPIIEVETYAWTQLPNRDHPPGHDEIESGIAQEIRYAHACAESAQAPSESA